MRSNITIFILGLVTAACLGVVIALSVVYLGLADVAAASPWPKWLDSMLHRAMLTASARRSKSLKLPPLDNPALLRLGYREYREECAGCHSAPGQKPLAGPIGMNPVPPTLYAMKDKLTNQQVYWLTQNGIKMTGMPAWGNLHDDKTLTAITAFVHTLPTLKAEDYKAYRP
jgi:mono/diheme cytochrome c family protein